MEKDNIVALKERIKDAGMTCADFAYLARVDLSTIYNITSGRNLPSHYVLKKFYDILRLTPEEFVSIFFTSSQDPQY